MKQLIKRALDSSYSYQAYKNLMVDLVRNHETTGPVQSKKLIEYTKLNAARMKRWDKTYVPSLETQQVVDAVNRPETWLVLTEAWCGDAAHNVPVLARIASFNPSINFCLALRDENTELMDLHLTRGGRSIPKLLRLTKDLKFLGSWGPRPEVLQNRILQEKMQPTMPKDEFTHWVHTWYNKDKGKTLEQELMNRFRPVEV
jgi:hypothetical protein